MTRPSHTDSPGTMERRETGTGNTGGAARGKVRAEEGVFRKPVESRTSRCGFGERTCRLSWDRFRAAQRMAVAEGGYGVLPMAAV